MRDLQKASQPALPAQKRVYESDKGVQLSIYSDAAASDNEIAMQMARLKVAFPKMDRNFFDLLAERVVCNGFTGKRLADAVNFLIDGFRYKELSIADVIHFDRSVKLYTGREFVSMQTKGYHPDEFDFVEKNGAKMWFLKEEYNKQL